MLSFTKKIAKKMKPIKNTHTSLLTLIMLLTITAPLVALSPVDAAVTTYNSYIFGSASPKLVGIGQSILLVGWTADLPPDIGETAGTVSSPNGRAGWNGMHINLTQPDG